MADNNLYNWYLNRFAMEVLERHIRYHDYIGRVKYPRYFASTDALRIHGVNMSLRVALPEDLPIVLSKKDVFSSKGCITVRITTIADNMWANVNMVELEKVYQVWTKQYPSTQ